jgi:hypothetical protein
MHVNAAGTGSQHPSRGMHWECPLQWSGVGSVLANSIIHDWHTAILQSFSAVDHE